MKKQQLLIIIILFLCISVFAQAQQNKYSRVFYDEQQNGIQANSIIPAFDNGFLIAGNGPSNNGIILKIDDLGNSLWNKTYTLSNSYFFFNGIITTNDSCYLLFGSAYNASTTNNEALFIKLNSLGDTIWSKSISQNGFNINAVSVQQTTDSGYIISGFTNDNNPPYNRIFTARLDLNGELLWSTIFTISNYDQIGYSVKQTLDSGFLIIGNFTDCSPCFSNAVLIKLTSSGMLSWSKKYHLTSSSFCSGYDFVNSMDGYLCYLNSGLMKIDFSGNILWTKSFDRVGGSNCYNCPAPKLRMTSDSAYILLTVQLYGIGSTIVKTDPDGIPLWADDLFLSAADVIESKNKELLIVGNGPMMGVKSPDIYAPQIGIIQTDSQGIGTECVFPNEATSIIDTVIASPITVATITGGIGNTIHPDINSIGIVEYTGCVDFIGGVEEDASAMNIKIYPNPAHETAIIKSEIDYKDATLTVYNTKMQIMIQQPLFKKYFEIDISGFKSGMYFVKIKTKNAVCVLKLVKD